MASGGMARLHLAVMTGIDGFKRIVALKRVLPHYAKSPEFMSMFINEARLAARLDHPNIIRIYELGERDDQYFISMEFLPAEDLAHIVRKARRLRRKVPVSIGATIAQNVADALQCAHELVDSNNRAMGLVHRDVSLSNVMVTYHGITKLADFGIAKATQVTGAATRAGVFKGKFAYAAPEQVLGKPVDARADIFALGIVLWELLAVKRLFKRSSDAATIAAVENAEVPPLRSLRSDVPQALDDIVLKALSKSRRDRFQSAQEMSDALEEFLRGPSGRASAKDMRAWIVELFGEQRSNLKKGVAQGIGIDEGPGGYVVSPEVTKELGLKSGETKDQSTSPQGANARGSGPRGSNQPTSKPAPAMIEDPDFYDPSGETELGAVLPSGSGARAGIVPKVSWSTNLNDRSPSSTLRAASSAVRNPMNLVDPATSAQQDTFNTPEPSQVQPQQGLFNRATIIGGLAGLAAVVLILAFKIAANSASATNSGQLDITSAPPGAEILVDGQMVGLKTPSLLQKLPTDRLVEIAIQKKGYATWRVSMFFKAGEISSKKVILSELGRVTIRNLRSGGKLFVDEKIVDPRDTLALTPGPHRFRVVVDSKVVQSGTWEIKAGTQVLSLRP